MNSNPSIYVITEVETIEIEDYVYVRLHSYRPRSVIAGLASGLSC